MKKMSLNFFGLLLGGVLLSACAQQPVVTPVATDPDIVSERLAKAAETAARALNDMSGIEQQRSPLPRQPDYANAPASMTQSITVKWTGPVEQITQTLASRAGLSFRTKGRAPAVPLTVVVDVYQQPLIQVLHDLGLQVGRRADLTVDGRAGVIEIRYAPSEK